MTTTLSRPPAVKKAEPTGSPAGVRAIKRVLPSGLQLIILTLLVLFPVGFVLLAAFTDPALAPVPWARPPSPSAISRSCSPPAR